MIIIKRNNNKADQVITIIMTIVQRKTGCYDTNHHQVRKECGTRDVTSLQLGVPKGQLETTIHPGLDQCTTLSPFWLSWNGVGSDHSFGWNCRRGIASWQSYRHLDLRDTLVLVLAKASIVGYRKKAAGSLD